MQIFKFGGTPMEDAAGVRNVTKILEKIDYVYSPIVISAMGKTTDVLEVIVNSYFKAPAQLPESLQTTKDSHCQVIRGLFSDENHPVYWKVGGLFAELSSFLERSKSPKHSFMYDQVIGFGELLSIVIIGQYLNDNGIKNSWISTRGLIKTDSNYRDAGIDWEEAQANISSDINKSLLNIIRGSLSSDANFFTTTLGREGSDYTAAIFAYCLNTRSIMIWKDVSGVLNADPRYFQHTQLLRRIPYREAIELVFYGASVIHPKALQPLQQEEILLYVRSFVNPTEKDDTVCNVTNLEPKVPCFISKKGQVLLFLSSRNLSFIMEEGINYTFESLREAQMKVSVIQNSAISFPVYVENKFDTLPELLEKLGERFKVSVTEGVTLYTIRCTTEAAIVEVATGKNVLLKQVSSDTV